MNLIIRRTEPTDSEGMKALYESTQAYTQTFHLPNNSLATWQKKLSNIPDYIYSYVAEIDGKIVGNIGLDDIQAPRQRHIGRIWIALLDDYQGQGIGTKLMQTIIDLAENWLGITRIELTVYTDNDKAIKLYQKFGFVIEGEAVNFALRNGQFVNAYYMARIKE